MIFPKYVWFSQGPARQIFLSPIEKISSKESVVDGSIFVSYKKISSKGSVMVVSFLNIFLKKLFLFLFYTFG